MMTIIRRLFCRHADERITYEGARVYLECPNCGRQTKGWLVSGKPRRRFEGDYLRHRLRRAS